MFTREKSCLFAFLVAFVPMTAANATVVTYTGNPFTESVGPFGTLDVDPAEGTSINASFTVDKSLAGSGSFTANDIISWSATAVGGFTITSTTPDSQLTALFDYANNQITVGEWAASAPPNAQIFSYSDYTRDDGATNNVYSQANIVFGNPGTYEVSAVPLPGTVGMLGTALLVLMGLTRLRWKYPAAIAA